MKYLIYSILLIALVLTACSPSNKILGSWVDQEALPATPFKSVFVMVISQNTDANYTVESQMVKLLKSRGRNAVKSGDVFPPKFSPMKDLNREQLAAAIKKTGCDAVMTIALLDTKTEHRYQPGTAAYYPAGFGFYSNYYSYYNYYSPQIYSQGYYTADKTFYIETNFYDLTKDKLLWSVQSESYSPRNLESFFKSYSGLLLSHLKKEKIIAK